MTSNTTQHSAPNSQDIKGDPRDSSSSAASQPSVVSMVSCPALRRRCTHTTPLSRGGDSGAAIVGANNDFIAQLTSGSGPTDSSHITYGTPHGVALERRYQSRVPQRRPLLRRPRQQPGSSLSLLFRYIPRYFVTDNVHVQDLARRSRISFFFFSSSTTAYHPLLHAHCLLRLVLVSWSPVSVLVGLLAQTGALIMERLYRFVHALFTAHD